MSSSEMAVPEAAGVEIHGMTRSSFILRGAVAAGGLYGAGAVSSFVSSALAQTASSDVDVLNFALTLEYLEAAFYKTALGKVQLPADIKALATEIGGHEQQHVATLTQTITQLGGKPVAAPTVKFPLTNTASFLKLAQTFEDTGVGAYNGAAPMISSKDVLAAAGSIVQVEARHAAAIRLKNNANPAPDAFDKPIPKAAVLTAVKPFLG